MSGIDYGGSCTRAVIDDKMMRADGKKSNYQRLFGTPERAARTLTYSTPICIDCAIRDGCEKKTCIIDKYDTMLEWLRCDA